LLPRDSIKVIAESVGIENLNNDVATGLASDVEYRLREIIQEAMKFMRHSKREKLTTEDINNALRLRNVETLYGFSGNEPLKFVKAVGTKDLYFVDDKELDFSEIANMPLPEAPRETSLSDAEVRRSRCTVLFGSSAAESDICCTWWCQGDPAGCCLVYPCRGSGLRNHGRWDRLYRCHQRF